MSNYVYVLRLAEGKYYVGKAANVLRRCQAHASGNGSEWTKKYQLVDLIECSEEKSQFDEDNKVKELMMKYGFANVRGGAYSKVELTQVEIDLLRRELSGAKDLCFGCGAAGHFVSACPLSKSAKQDAPQAKQAVASKAAQSRPLAEPAPPLVTGLVSIANALTGSTICSRCGRENHTADKCYAKTNTRGESLVSIPASVWRESDRIEFIRPIARATYGPEGISHDVTVLIQQVQARGIKVLTGGVNSFIGDPFPGKPKVLKVWY